MEQHPIPQQISSYQFRLVGDMTLKQFFQLAGGVLFALLFYASRLHPLIKWPIMSFFVLLGVGLAFFPLGERPLEKWIVAFFKAIYSPTLFSWKKTEGKVSYFQEETAASTEETQISRVQEKRGGISAKFEELETSFLSKLSDLWSFPVVQSVPSLAQAAPFPKLVIEEKTPTQEKIQEIKITPITPSSTFSPSGATSAVVFSLEAAPPAPPTTPNTVVGQVIDGERKIVEGAILEIRDAAGRPVRALKSNKLGHFLIVTPLINGKYEIITEKEGFDFDPVVFETIGTIIPPMAISGRKLPIKN